MTAAAFALAGVITGALLSGLVQYILELRREREIAKSAARILQADLYRVSAILGYPSYRVEELFGPGLGPEQTWREHRNAIVGYLTEGEWDQVRYAWEVVTHYAAEPTYFENRREEASLAVNTGGQALNRIARITPA
jgi:hypothetical protein